MSEEIQDPKEESSQEATPELPEFLLVRNTVRAVETRLQRHMNCPSRPHFKQYLFNDPACRLVRSRPLKVARARVLANLEELIQKERFGILQVTTMDGRPLDLSTMTVAPAAPPAPQPHPPLDSASNDAPAGEHMPVIPGGIVHGDPAAQRAAAELAAEKTLEAEAKAKEEEADALTKSARDQRDSVAPLDLGSGFIDPASQRANEELAEGTSDSEPVESDESEGAGEEGEELDEESPEATEGSAAPVEAGAAPGERRRKKKKGGNR